MNSKINLLFIAPEEGIGGGNRKFLIYFNNLSDNFFNKYYVKLCRKQKSDKPFDEIILSEKYLKKFILEKNIYFVYLAKNVSKDFFDFLNKNCVILKNVNFTNIYSPKNNVLNLVISKTDYWKLKWIHKKLINTYVVYNPIDFDKWLMSDKLSTAQRPTKNKIIIGRLARAEPSKWHYLMIETLYLLDKNNEQDFGFVFAGMPYLYKKTLQLILSKKMLNNIIFLPEIKHDEEITKFYKAIDIFWQTSWVGESFGNVIAEAYCFKKPVITDFKHFYKNGRINIKRYDAQCELVDHEKTGFYCNSPKIFISTIKKLSLKDIDSMGRQGFEKCKKNYDAKIASETLTKILYRILLKKKRINKQKEYDELNIFPSVIEIKKFEKEYHERLRKAEEYNPQDKAYLFRKRIWRMIEYIYLFTRFLLKKFNYDLEKQKKCAA